MSLLLVRSPYDREIARLALPALGALAADPLISLIDTAFVGRLGKEALAAVALASAIFAVAFAVFNFLEYAVTPLVAAAVGAGNRREAGATTSAAFALGLVSGVVAGVVLFVFGDTFLELLGAEGEVLVMATEYLDVRLLAMPAVLSVMVGHGVFRGYQDTRTPLAVTLGVNVINLVLDPILIFGLDWGIVGAATATVIAQWVGAIAFWVLVFGSRRRELGVTFDRVGTKILRPLLGAGGKLVLRNASLLAAITVSTAAAARTGTAAVAAHQVLIQLWIFLALALDALAIAGQAMVGKMLGAGSARIARVVANRLTVLGIAFGVVLAAALAFIRPWVGSWFTSDVAVIAAFGSAYWFVIAAQPLNAYVFVGDGVAIGASAFRMLAWSTFAGSVTAVAVMLAGLRLDLGLPAVWWGLTALMLVRAAAMWRWYGTGPLGAVRDPAPSSRAG